MSPTATKAKNGGSLVSSSPKRAASIFALPSIINREGIENNAIAFILKVYPSSADVPKVAPAPKETRVL